MKNLILFVIFGLLSSTLLSYAPQTEKEIKHLYKFIKESNVKFFRNGKEHRLEDAIKHIKKKEKHYKKKIKTTEDFIKKSAMKSTMSGKYYFIKYENKKKEKCSEWLLVELKQLRKIEK
ncbi:MAG: hypothetical protein COA79_01625 [Planctomycetota bacterium]|nr:MAG: hypothetical protein COA79_01625 [Planctomycetota bacterium]